MSLHSYSLTTLANLKEVLGITDNTQNSLLTNLINRATDIIEKYCNGKRFLLTTYTREEYNGTGSKMISLNHFPIITLTAYEQNQGTIGDPSWSTVEASGIKAINETGQVYYSFGFARGIRNYRFTYTAGYATIPTDLEQACLDICVYIYNVRKNSGMKSESLGEYSYTKDDAIGNVIKDLGIDLMLDQYREPVI